MPPEKRLRPLKILIASQPKTGNTWLKHLLSFIFELPIVGLPLEAQQIPWEALGERWIGHQHYLPSDGLLSAGQQRGIHFITTLRHPADALISLFHHVRRQKVCDDDPSSASSMALDGETLGHHTIQFIKHGFNQHLYLSMAWLNAHASHLVRYEELWAEPQRALKPLVETIDANAVEKIPAAIDACDLSSMRKKFLSERAFFRKGGVDNWRLEMPRAVQRALATCPDLTEYFEALGYTMTTTDAWVTP